MSRSGLDTALDPRQQRYVECGRQMRALIAEMRELKRQLKVGTCEVCGKEFVRERVTRKHCSQNCTIRAYGLRTDNKHIDLELLRVVMPVIRAGGFVSPRNCDIVERVIATGSQSIVAEEVHLPRQRVNQLLMGATRQARRVKAILAASQSVASSAVMA